MTHHTIYVSQSGSPDGRFVTFGWVEAPATSWGDLMEPWANFRRELHRTRGIPASDPLRHALRYDPAVAESVRARFTRRSVLDHAMHTLTANPHIRVGSVWASAPTPGDFTIEKAALYSGLVELLNTRLSENADTGIVFVDGDATDPTYYRAHRRLGFHRSLIEDPIFTVARRTMGGEMADLVAWTAFQFLVRLHDPDFYWDLYAPLRTADVNGGEPWGIDTDRYKGAPA